MKRHEDIFNKLASLAKENKSQLHILEEKIPVDEQFAYFNYSKKLREDIGYSNIDKDELISNLFNPELLIREKQKCLSLLAGIPDVTAYRAIETYHSSPQEPELANWSAMALMESRLLLNSDLTGEQQIFVSTGLGGHKTKLRYFFVVSTKNKQALTSLQCEIIEREFRYQFDSLNIEIEKMVNDGFYYTFLVLAELEIDIKKEIDNIVKECNQYGNFISETVLITNAKILSQEEIERSLSRDEKE